MENQEYNINNQSSFNENPQLAQTPEKNRAETKKKSKIVIVLLVIFIIILTLVAAWFIYDILKSKNNESISGDTLKKNITASNQKLESPEDAKIENEIQSPTQTNEEKSIEEYPLNITYGKDELKEVAEKNPEYLSAIKNYVYGKYKESEMDRDYINIRFNTFITVNNKSTKATTIEVYNSGKHYVLDNWGHGNTFEEAIINYLENRPEILEKKLREQLKLENLNLNHNQNSFEYTYDNEVYIYWIKGSGFSNIDFPENNFMFIFSEPMPEPELLTGYFISSLARSSKQAVTFINEHKNPVLASSTIFYFDEDRKHVKTQAYALGDDLDNEKPDYIKVLIDLESENIYLNTVDEDNDGLSDFMEIEYGTDHKIADTDRDGFTDNEELKRGYDPNGKSELTAINNIPVINSAPYVTCYREKDGEREGTDCPLKFQIRDPMGYAQSRSLASILGAVAKDVDINDDGGEEQYIEIPFPEYGKYIISLFPDSHVGWNKLYDDVLFDIVSTRKEEKITLDSGSIIDLKNYNLPLYIIEIE